MALITKSASGVCCPQKISVLRIMNRMATGAFHPVAVKGKAVDLAAHSRDKSRILRGVIGYGNGVVVC
jgi:hypothetical protein